VDGLPLRFELREQAHTRDQPAGGEMSQLRARPPHTYTVLPAHCVLWQAAATAAAAATATATVVWMGAHGLSLIRLS